MTTKYVVIYISSIITAQAALPAAAAEDPAVAVEALKRQIQELDQKVRILERHREDVILTRVQFSF